MGRKKRSVFDDLVDLASRLPWWMGVLLALVSYLAIHPFASMPTTAPGATSLDKFSGHRPDASII